MIQYHVSQEKLSIHTCSCTHVPVVPHKAVAEVSKIGNL